jgi:hypothetical protein
VAERDARLSRAPSGGAPGREPSAVAKTPYLDLAALIAAPDNGGLRLVSGDETATWAGLRMAIVGTDLPTVRVGAAAILMTPPPTAPWQQDALIRRVRDKGYSILALPETGILAESSLRLAARLGLAVVHVDSPLELALTCWHLEEGRDALTLSYVRKVAQSIKYRATNLHDLLRHLSASVGHGLALVDPHGTLMEVGGTLPAEVHAAIDFSTWLDIVSLPAGCAASVEVHSGRDNLRIAFFGPRLSAAQLSALGVAAEVSMPAVAARFLIDEVNDVSDTAISSGLLRDLLEQHGSPDPDLEQRMLDRGWRMDGHHLAFRCVGLGRVDNLHLLTLIVRELGDHPVESHATTSGRGITGWLTFPGPPSPEAVETHVAALRALHTSVRRSANIATGVGTVEVGGSGLATSVSRAVEACRLASHRSSTGWFVRTDTLGIEQFMLSWASSDTFLPMARSLLAPLVDAGADLLPTLTAYLDHESAIAATAEELGLHRNTVSARVARAQDLLALDLDDPETRIAVHLACRALRAASGSE